MTWTRERLESLPHRDLPRIPVRLNVIARVLGEDTPYPRTFDTEGRIWIAVQSEFSDVVVPWIEVSYGSLHQHAEPVTWDFLLKTLNDPFPSPYVPNKEAEIEI